jgi:hypothetical protein
MDLKQALNLKSSWPETMELQRVLVALVEWFDAAYTHHPHPLYPIKNLPGELPWLYCEVCDWAWDYLDPVILQEEYLVRAKMTVDKKGELARIKGGSKPPVEGE